MSQKYFPDKSIININHILPIYVILHILIGQVNLTNFNYIKRPIYIWYQIDKSLIDYYYVAHGVPSIWKLKVTLKTKKTFICYLHKEVILNKDNLIKRICPGKEGMLFFLLSSTSFIFHCYCTNVLFGNVHSTANVKKISLIIPLGSNVQA